MVRCRADLDFLAPIFLVYEVWWMHVCSLLLITMNLPILITLPTKHPCYQLQQHKTKMPRIATDDNVENRFELFLLGDGEKKVTEAADTREFLLLSNIRAICKYFRGSTRTLISTGIPSTSIFTFNKEDHTLGNLLRARLLQSSHVSFAGYRVPHPLFR